MLAWIKANWGTVVIVIGVVCTILNAATTIWRDHPTAIKWLSFIISALSVVRSKGEPDGPLGALKLPGVPEQIGPRPPFVGALVPFALLSASMFAACATTPRGYLSKALVAVGAADQVAIPAIQKVCAPKVQACPPGPAESCPAFVSCAKALTTYQATATAITRELETLNKLLFDLEVK